MEANDRNKIIFLSKCSNHRADLIPALFLHFNTELDRLASLDAVDDAIFQQKSTSALVAVESPSTPSSNQSEKGTLSKSLSTNQMKAALTDNEVKPDTWCISNNQYRFCVLILLI